MGIETELTHSSAVLIAHDVNISIFKPWWLMKAGILREEELEGNVVVTPITVQISAPAFEMAVFPNRIQMTFKHEGVGDRKDITRVLGGIVKTLPHTPYSAVGLNFHYLATTNGRQSFDLWSKKVFASPFAKLVASGEDRGARFGSYVSVDVLGARLKLDVKPITLAEGPTVSGIRGEPGQEFAKVDFNFHLDLQEGTEPDQIVRVLNRWTRALSFSKKVVRSLEKAGSRRRK